VFRNLFQLPHIDIPDWKWPWEKAVKYKFPRLQIGDTTANIPIIQGGMGVGISLSGLAAAVAQEGAIGVIAANAIGMIEPDFFKNGREANIRALRNELRKSRQLTGGIIGVNIMVATNDFHELLQVCIEEKADMVFLGAGLPIRDMPVKELRAANVKILPIVSSARAAALIFKYWQNNYQDIPDGVVVEGPLAGGHLGFRVDQIDHPDYNLEKIIPGVIETIAAFAKQWGRHIPVIAAGGIFTGDDVYRFLQMGADGVQMGTRFVATHECDADIKFKEAYTQCRKEDIVIIQSPVGLPGRAIKSPFFEALEGNNRDFSRCAWKCLESCEAQDARYCIALALDYARKGNLEKGFAFAGANAFRVDKITSVKELLGSLYREFGVVLEKNTVNLRREYDKTLEKLASLKNEYALAVEKATVLVKKKYGHVLTRGSEALNEEFPEIIARITRLKEEYIEYGEKVKLLLNEISLVPLVRSPVVA